MIGIKTINIIPILNNKNLKGVLGVLKKVSELKYKFFKEDKSKLYRMWSTFFSDGPNTERKSKGIANNNKRSLLLESK